MYKHKTIKPKGPNSLTIKLAVLLLTKTKINKFEIIYVYMEILYFYIIST